ncbi:hypothetical protein ACFL0Y_04130 [Patescibacteria group bacterium]
MVTIFDSNQNSQPAPQVPEISTPPEPKKTTNHPLEKVKTPPPPPPEKPSPKKPEDIKPYTPNFAELIKTYQDYYLDLELETETGAIYVDEIASKVARFYEKIRKVVDWKEKHLERRAAIERILKRKFISEISGFGLIPDIDSEKIAEPLVMELIRAGHFPNNKIPRNKVGIVKIVLDKYIYILKKNQPKKGVNVTGKIKKKFSLYNWITEIAACEIEEVLEPPIRQKALIEFMANSMAERIKLEPDNLLSGEEKTIQIYLATYRTLFHLDSPIISYYLLKSYWPQWKQAPVELIHHVANNISEVQKKIASDLEHPMRNKFFSLCEKIDTVFLILGDVLDSFAKNPEDAFKKLKEKSKLIDRLTKAYDLRLSTLKTRLFRAAIYSTLSIFVAGALSLFIFEVPLANWLYGSWEPLAIVVDLMLPTLMMAFLVIMIKTPKKNNFERLTKEVQKVAYQQKRIDLYEIFVSPKKRKFLKGVTGVLYLLGAALSLALIFWLFKLAQVPPTSLYIDTVNVALVVFAGLVIRHRSKELTVEEKPSFWEFSLDILSVPMAKMGQWLANKWKEYNVVSVFFTTLIDMPFSSFVEFIEGWRSYLNERKTEIH